MFKTFASRLCIKLFIQNLTCILILFTWKIKIILYMYLCLRTESHVGFLLKHRLTSANVFTMKLFLCLFVLWKFPIQRTQRARWKGLFTVVLFISDTKYTPSIWLNPVLILLSPFAPGKLSVFPSAVADMLSLTLRQRLQVSTFCLIIYSAFLNYVHLYLLQETLFLHVRVVVNKSLITASRPACH